MVGPACACGRPPATGLPAGQGACQLVQLPAVPEPMRADTAWGLPRPGVVGLLTLSNPLTSAAAGAAGTLRGPAVATMRTWGSRGAQMVMAATPLPAAAAAGEGPSGAGAAGVGTRTDSRGGTRARRMPCGGRMPVALVQDKWGLAALPTAMQPVQAQDFRAMGLLQAGTPQSLGSSWGFAGASKAPRTWQPAGATAGAGAALCLQPPKPSAASPASPPLKPKLSASITALLPPPSKSRPACDSSQTTEAQSRSSWLRESCS